MPVARQADAVVPNESMMWPMGGRHLWSSGATSHVQRHRCGHLVYAVTGVLAVRTSLGTAIVPANRIAWTPAGIEHQETMHGTTDMRIVFVSSALAELLPQRPAVFLASALAREVLLALTDYRADTRTLSRDARSLARLHRVLVDEMHEVLEQSLHLPTPHDDRLQALARTLVGDLAANASLADLGQQVGASARTLSRLLRRELGMTFYEWRTQMRIYRALVLLAEGHDTTHTALACGWTNPSSFISAFASVVGVTPGRYRANL